VKLLKPFLPDVCEDDLKRVAPLIKERIKTLKEAQELLAFLCQSCDYDSDILVQKKMGLRGTRLALKKIKEIIEENGVKKAKKLQEKFMELIEKRDWKVGEFFMILRVAICGKKITPPITESLALLEKEKVLQQLDFALQKLEDLDETH